MSWKVPMPRSVPAKGLAFIRLGIKTHDGRFELEQVTTGLSVDRAAMLMLVASSSDKQFQQIHDAVNKLTEEP